MNYVLSCYLFSLTKCTAVKCMLSMNFRENPLIFDDIHLLLLGVSGADGTIAGYFWICFPFFLCVSIQIHVNIRM